MTLKESLPLSAMPIALGDSEGLGIPEALCLWQMAPSPLVGFWELRGACLYSHDDRDIETEEPLRSTRML